MPRIRIHFSKRGTALFVPHVDLPILFTRAARRAGISMEYTQGFTPRPRTAFGPPLPVGVVGISEPAEIWFDEWNDELLHMWKASLPNGFEIANAQEVSGEGLAKLCRDASYIIEPLNGTSNDAITLAIASEFEAMGVLLQAKTDNDAVKIAVTDPERSGVSRMVKLLVSESLVSGWRDLAVGRVSVGLWDRNKNEIVPLWRNNNCER